MKYSLVFIQPNRFSTVDTYHLQTSIMEVKCSSLRVVIAWMAKLVEQFPQELELIMWPVIIDGFLYLVNGASVVVQFPAKRQPSWQM